MSSTFWIAFWYLSLALLVPLILQSFVTVSIAMTAATFVAIKHWYPESVANNFRLMKGTMQKMLHEYIHMQSYILYIYVMYMDMCVCICYLYIMYIYMLCIYINNRLIHTHTCAWTHLCRLSEVINALLLIHSHSKAQCTTTTVGECGRVQRQML